MNTLPPTISFGWNKDLVIVRGFPGSGKSTKARELLGHKPCFAGQCDRLVEADQFFMNEGKYEWHSNMRDLAHQWCLAETFRKLRHSDRVVVANTFVKRWQIFPYIEQARQLKIRVYIHEAPGNGLPAITLAARNVHSVPVESIERMMIDWEDFTQEEVNVLLGFCQGHTS